jgi:NAD-dependent dihydropyrimidine dehydrogenase PreA subunit
VITIRAEYCNGCGACVEVCPTGAIYLVDGAATVDRERCSACEACLAACPAGAIVVVGERQPEAEPVRVPALRVEPGVVQVKAELASRPVRSKVLPVVGAALVWVGREIVPRLADYLLYGLERPLSGQRATSTDRNGRAAARSGEARARQHRHRRRGGESGK